MSLSPVAFFGSLDPTNPVGSDSRTIADDQFRNNLQSMRDQCPNWTGAVTATHTEVNLLAGYVSNGVKPLPGEGGVTTMFHYGTTAPVGWTIIEPDANIRELIIGPAAGGGVIGGLTDPITLEDTVSVTISGNTGSTSVAHTHTFSGATGINSADINKPDGAGNEVASDPHTHNFGGTTAGMSANDPHVHDQGTLAGNGLVSILPRYARGILMQLDA